MYSNYNKIFWGVIFTLININIMKFDIFPNFIGYGLIVSGLSFLYNRSKENSFYLAKIFAIIGFVQSLVGLFYRPDMMQEFSPIGMAYAITSQIFYILLVFYIYTGMIQNLDKDKDKEDLIETMIIARQICVWVMVITTFIMTFVPNIASYTKHTLTGLLVIVNLIMAVRWAFHIYCVRNCYKEYVKL